MNPVLVDTDWIIDALHGQAAAIQTLESLAPRGLTVSVISYGELYQGVYYARDPVRSLEGLRSFLDGKDLLPVTGTIMETFGILRGGLSRKIRQQVGELDLLIAATALAHDLTLLTRNLRDFQLIPDLKLHGEESEP